MIQIGAKFLVRILKLSETGQLSWKNIHDHLLGDYVVKGDYFFVSDYYDVYMSKTYVVTSVGGYYFLLYSDNVYLIPKKVMKDIKYEKLGTLDVLESAPIFHSMIKVNKQLRKYNSWYQIFFGKYSRHFKKEIEKLNTEKNNSEILDIIR